MEYCKVWISNSNYFYFSRNHTVWHLESNPFLTSKWSKLNSFLWSSSQEGFLRNLSDFSRRIKPLKNSRKDSKWSLFQKNYNWNSVGNWKWTQWVKPFRIINSSILPSLNIFGIREGSIFELKKLSKVWIIGKMFVHWSWARPSATVTDRG
jgi:hypothetical protein